MNTQVVFAETKNMVSGRAEALMAIATSTESESSISIYFQEIHEASNIDNTEQITLTETEAIKLAKSILNYYNVTL